MAVSGIGAAIFVAIVIVFALMAGAGILYGAIEWRFGNRRLGQAFVAGGIIAFALALSTQSILLVAYFIVSVLFAAIRLAMVLIRKVTA